MRLRWSHYAAEYRLAAAVGARLSVYAGFAIWFYWLMQPSVVTNYGLAAYRPPPKAVVNYDLPRVPPAAVEPHWAHAVAEPPTEMAESSVVESKKEIKKQEVRTTPRRERPVRERPFWDFASTRSSGSRPWF
jgi:hypothetical protein